MGKKNQKDKSGNPNNKDCSSCRQVLLDLVASGFPEDEINKLLDFANKNPDKLKSADKKFSEHQYPSHSMQFIKMSNEVEFCKNITAQSLAVLTAMCQNMRHGNTIQLSQDDLLKLTGIGNKKTISKALKELKEKGYIVIMIDGNTRFSPVYMINPSIATAGKEIRNLQMIFWKKSGTEFSLNKDKTIKSIPHQKWEIDMHKRTYSIGYDKQETESGTVYFNKINPPKIEENKTSGAATPDVDNNSPDEDLPI